MKRTTVTEIIAILYVILFLYTGISKIIDYTVFKEQIATSPLLSPVAKPIAWSLPWIEFLIVVLLIVPRWRLKGLVSSLILMTVFTIYILAILAFNKNIPCSCGGIIEELSWGQHIIFNTLFILLAVVGIRFQKKVIKDKLIGLSTITNNDWAVQA